jgi:ABC-type transporter MlaC component
MKNQVSKILFGFAFIASISHAADNSAQDRVNKDSAEVLKTGQRLENEKAKEKMRDKSLDNMLPVGKDSAVGVDSKGLTYKKTIP